MPLQRRLPKRGFLAVTITKAAEVRSGDLAQASAADAIDLDGLKKAGLVPGGAKRAKIILAGKLEQDVQGDRASAPPRARRRPSRRPAARVADDRGRRSREEAAEEAKPAAAK